MRQIVGSPLWIGHAGDVRDSLALHAAGILAVVDLAREEPPAALGRELFYARLPLVDGAENPRWLVRMAVDTVAGLIKARVPTLVGCGAGLSRSPVIAAAALARLRGCSMAEGLAFVVENGRTDVSPGLWSEVQHAIG